MEKITINEFCDLLNKYCHNSNSWNNIQDIPPMTEFSPCECCGWHSLTQKLSTKLNKFVNNIKTQGGPAPCNVYLHCRNELFIEWWSNPPEFKYKINAEFISKNELEILVSCELNNELKLYSMTLEK